MASLKSGSPPDAPYTTFDYNSFERYLQDLGYFFLNLYYGFCLPELFSKTLVFFLQLGDFFRQGIFFGGLTSPFLWCHGFQDSGITLATPTGHTG